MCKSCVTYVLTYVICLVKLICRDDTEVDLVGETHPDEMKGDLVCETCPAEMEGDLVGETRPDEMKDDQL